MYKYLITTLVVTSLASISHGATVVVSPGNMGSWAFVTTDNNGNPGGDPGDIAQMVNGPATPPLGTGSAQLSTAPNHGDESAQISTTQYDGLALSNLTTLSYSTYCTANNGQQFPYIQLSVTTNGPGPVADDVLFFEPPYQTPITGNPGLPNQSNTVMNTWQLWDAKAGGWWSDDGLVNLNPGTGVGSLASFLAAYPNSTIVANPFTGNGGISLTMGYAGPSDFLTGYVDNVTIGTQDGGNTTFDFETVPEPASLTLLAFGGLLAFFCRWKKSRA